MSEKKEKGFCLTLRELKKLEELNRKKAREDNAYRQRALGLSTEPKPDPVVSPDLIIGKTPEERKAFFDKLRREAGLDL